MQFTYRIFFIALSVTLFFVLSTFGSLAQTTNNPNDDSDANACFPGGSLYDTCNTRDADRDGDIDESDQNWMWVCGWFLIRVEYGLFSDDILDGICLDIIVEIIVEEEEKKKKVPKCQIQIDDDEWAIYRISDLSPVTVADSDLGLPECIVN